MSSQKAEEPAFCTCGQDGEPYPRDILPGFSRSPVTGFWNHGCGKPKRAWWEGHQQRIAASTPDP